MQQKQGMLEQKMSLLIVMEFHSLWPANFSSNCNVALYAHSLILLWFSQMKSKNNSTWRSVFLHFDI